MSGAALESTPICQPAPGEEEGQEEDSGGSREKKPEISGCRCCNRAPPVVVPRDRCRREDDALSSAAHLTGTEAVLVKYHREKGLEASRRSWTQ